MAITEDNKRFIKMTSELKTYERLRDVFYSLKQQIFEQESVYRIWFAAAAFVFIISLIVLRWAVIIPVYFFFVASFVAGISLINDDTLCPNILLTFVRPVKKEEKSLVKDDSCHICGHEGCGRHKIEMSVEQLSPWVDLELPQSVNSALENLFELILKEYVHSWYDDFSSDEAFIDEIKGNIRYVVSILLRRIYKVDLATLISSKALNLSLRHLDHCLTVLQEEGSSEKYDSLEKLKTFEQKLLESYGSNLHIAARTRQLETQYIDSISHHLLLHLLPSISSKPFHVLMKELLSNVVLLPCLDLIADPDIINNLLIIALEESTGTVESKPAQPRVPVLHSFHNKNSNKNKQSMQLQVSNILGDPELLYPFMQFMKSHSSVNVLQLYLLIEEFNRKILTPDLSSDKLCELHLELRKLYDTFFDPSAKDCIKFDSDLTSQLKAICDGNSKDVIKLQTTTPLFRAYEHTYDLLEHNFLPLFHQSDIFFTMMYGERPPTNESKKTSMRGLKRGSTSESFSKLSTKLKGVFRNNAVDGTRLHDEVDYDVEEVQVESSTEENVEIKDLCEEEDDEDEVDGYYCDLSLWVVSIPSLKMDANKKNVVFEVEVKRLVDDQKSLFEEWFIDRRYHEFYVLETKLKEFHGVFEECQLPAKKTFLPKDKSFYESLRPHLESFLRILITKPTLRSSQLLHSFLTSQQEFTTSFLDVNLGKKMKSGAMKLVRERGQHLESFLKSFLASTEPPKSKTSKSVDCESDTVSIASDKVLNSIYGNNANLPLLPWPSQLPPSSSSSSSPSSFFARQIDSYFDAFIYLCWRLFESGGWLMHVLWSLRTLAKRTVDCFMDWWVDANLREALSDDQITRLIELFKEAVFFDNDPPRTTEDKLERRKLAYQTLHQFIPGVLMRSLGNTESGLRLLFNLLQLPRLNKQLAYTLLDALLLQLFPEFNGGLEKK